MVITSSNPVTKSVSWYCVSIYHFTPKIDRSSIPPPTILCLPSTVQAHFKMATSAHWDPKQKVRFNLISIGKQFESVFWLTHTFFFILWNIKKRDEWKETFGYFKAHKCLHFSLAPDYEIWRQRSHCLATEELNTLPSVVWWFLSRNSAPTLGETENKCNLTTLCEYFCSFFTHVRVLSRCVLPLPDNVLYLSRHQEMFGIYLGKLN